MSPASTLDPVRAAGCVGCGKPVSAAHRPFCSRGCRDRDLLQWLSDGYRLPGPSADGAETSADGLDS